MITLIYFIVCALSKTIAWDWKVGFYILLIERLLSASYVRDKK